MKLPKIIQDSISHHCNTNEDIFGYGWWYINKGAADDVIAFLMLFITDVDIARHDGVIRNIGFIGEGIIFAAGRVNAEDSKEDNTRDQINLIELSKYLLEHGKWDLEQ